MTLGRWTTRGVRGVYHGSAGAVPRKRARRNGVGRQEGMPGPGAEAAEAVTAKNGAATHM
jgi:hypothetical protein